MTVLVLGGEGRQGKAVRYALKRLGVPCESFDLDDTGEQDMDAAHKVDVTDADVVLSCLPWSCNRSLGKIATNRGKIWCDLGGHTQTSKHLHAHVICSGKGSVATDLGLGPGLVEYLGFKVLKDKQPRILNLYCGGVPVSPKNFFGYSLSFSKEGVVNEYVNDCQSLFLGSLRSVEPMREVNRIPVGDVVLEAANTSGGLSPGFLQTVAANGVLNCGYKTLRWPGHWEIVRDVWSRCSTQKQFADWIELACQPPGPDIVYIAVHVDDGEKMHWEIGDHRSEDNGEQSLIGLTAMQRATAFPTAAAVACIAEQDDLPRVITAYEISENQKFWTYLRKLLPLEGC